MARRRRADEPEASSVPAPGAAAADPPGAPRPAAEQPTGVTVGQPAARNRPAARFAAHSDRTTRIEVAVWAKQVRGSDAEEYTQYSLTLSRSWRDKDGQWFGNAAFRVHDLPVLLYLVGQAYHWCLAQRTTVRVESDGAAPF